VADNGTAGFAGDGRPALSAEFDDPNQVAVDAAGNLVISDTSFDTNGNQRIRVVAERTGTFYGVPMTAGDVYTVAGTGTAGFNGDGGKATSAELFTPQGVAVDGAGNLLIGDYGNNRVRVAADHSGTFYGRAMTAGHIYSVAGDGTAGFAGDGGPATSAELFAPEGVTVDSAGNLVIADAGNARVRVVAARTGTFYATAMTAGHIHTVPGTAVPASPGTAGRPPPPSSASRRGSGSTAPATRSSPTPPPHSRATSAAITGSGWPPPAPARSSARP
jgi:NHL repeat-containing protein